MAGTIKGFTDLGYECYAIGGLHIVPMFKVASIGAGAVSTTVQDRFITPCRCKISAIALYASAVNTIDGSVSFNIAVGTGSYETGAVAATGSYTLTGVPTDGDTNTYVIGGVSIPSAQATANSLSQQATADAAAITAASALVSAVAVGANINLTAKESGPNGNAITTTGSSNGGDTVTANQATLAGGVAGTGIATVQNDNRPMPTYNGASTVQPGGQIAGGGAGITTNYAVAGQALFANDVLFNAASMPLMTTGGGQAVFGDVVTTEGGVLLAASDATFQRGQLLTLRATTPAGAGSISNLLVCAVMQICPLNIPQTPAQLQLNNPIQALNAPGPTLVNVRPASGFTF